MVKTPQGRRLINILKKRRMTYLEMLLLGISVCPWKRIREQLVEGETLVKSVNKDGHMTWHVR